MGCPCFVEEYSGICVAHKLPYIPSICERDRYCSGENDFKVCPVYADNVSQNGINIDGLNGV